MKEQKLDLRIFLIEAILTQKGLRKKIDKIYNKHKLAYYQLAKKSPLYKDESFIEGDIFKEDYSKKLLGILLAATNSNTDEIITKDAAEGIENLIKSGWPFLYKHIIDNDEINLYNILEKFYIKKTISDDQFNAMLTIALILSINYEKSIVKNDLYDKFINQFHLRIEHYGSKYRFCYKNIKKDHIQKARQLKGRIEEFLDIKLETPWSFLSTQQEENRKYINCVMCLFDAEYFSFNTLVENVNWSERDFEEILALYYSFYKNQNREEATKFLVFGIILKSLLKSYRLNKEYFFKNNKETVFLEIDSIEKENADLKSKIEAEKETNKRLQKELELLKAEYKQGLERKIIEQQKEIQELQNKLIEWQENEKELAALRETIFEIEHGQPEDLEQKELEMPTGIRCLIVGGHEQWQSKLKDELPGNFKFLLGDKTNFDIKFLENIDFIFFYTAYMSHATYYRIVNYCKKTDIDFGYLKNSEISLVKNEIANYLTKLKK